MSSFTPTAEQLAIVEAATSTPDNLCLIAYAGAAKTSTLELICKALPSTPILSVAFNKRIADEMSTRLPGNVKAATLNSVGHRAWGATIGRRIILDTKKSFRILSDVIDELPTVEKTQAREEFATLLQAINVATTVGFVPSGVKHPSTHTLFTEEEYLDRLDDPPAFTEVVFEVLRRRIDESFEGTIDFNDQIYMPALFGGQFPRFPLVLVDEAQDLSPINHLFVQHLVTRRLIIVGDPYQSIYGFRGAVTNGMTEMASIFSMRRMGLSVSFRCPISVVEAARFRVPDMNWAPGAAEGSVSGLAPWSISDLPPSSAVICRRNAPLFTLAIRMIKAGKSFRLLGSDISASLLRTLKSFGKPTTPQSAVLDSIAKWKSEAIAKRPRRSRAITDRAECLEVIARNGTDLGGAIAYAERIFASEGSITLCSIHKAKGLEWHHVYHLDPWIIDPAEDEQEANCLYVAITRAKSSYTTINTEDLVD